MAAYGDSADGISPQPPDPLAPHVPGELLVQFAPGVSSARVKGLGAQQGYSVLESTPPLNVYRLKVQGDLQESWQDLVGTPGVLAVQPNYYHTWIVPNDPFYDNGQLLDIDADANDFQRWYLGPDILNAEPAWEITIARSDVTIAVIDAGVDLDHPDLEVNIWFNPGEVANNGVDDDSNGFVDDVNGWDFCGTSVFQDFGAFIDAVCTGQDNNPNPDLGDGLDNDDNGLADENVFHGTGVAGMADAVGNNGFGIAGAAWNASIMPLKVFTEEGSTSVFEIIDAISYAADNGADVINLSLGFTDSDPCPTVSPLEEAAISAAIASGVVVVAAAGNDNTGDPGTPASCSGVISVGASDHNSTFWLNVLGEPKDPDGRVFFSNFGPFVDVVAPGSLVTTDAVASQFDADFFGFDVGEPLVFVGVDGTSFSAPLVSGLAALVISATKDNGKTLTPAQVQNIVVSTAVDLPDDPDDSPDAGANWDGAGMVNFLAAVSEADASSTPPVLSLPGTITKEATGPAGAVVTYSASATDPQDGAVPITCNPASGSTFPLGNTAVNCSATDGDNNTSTGSFTVQVVDTTPPVWTTPLNPVFQGTGPAGALVTYNASATDLVDGAVAGTCNPPSGSTFPLGNTTVNCSATDSHGNTGTSSFTVQVLAPPPPLTGAVPGFTLWGLIALAVLTTVFMALVLKRRMRASS